MNDYKPCQQNKGNSISTQHTCQPFPLSFTGLVMYEDDAYAIILTLSK